MHPRLAAPRLLFLCALLTGWPQPDARGQGTLLASASTPETPVVPTLLAETPPTLLAAGPITDGRPDRRVATDVEAMKATINILRDLAVGLFVLLIQAGFLLVGVGLTRAKNAAYTSGVSLLTFAVGAIGFWACGFALMFGGVGPSDAIEGSAALDRMASITLAGKGFGVLGLVGFFLSGEAGSGGIASLFLLQMGFLATAASIPAGALAERWRMPAACLFGLAIAMVIYPAFGCWAWGGGWLAGLGTNFGIGNGFVDFAGSGVVHLTGGVAALVGSAVVGARIGKYRRDGTPNPIPGHNIPMVMVGSLLLASGWIALTAGGGLASADLGVGAMAARALLAAAAGCLGSCAYAWLFFGRPDPTLCCNGLLAGTVAIAAPCAFVSPVGAVVIGLLAGLLAIGGVLMVERLLRVDDPMGVIGVHGICGAFGCLCVGLFAAGDYGKGWNGVDDVTPLGIFYGGGFGQLLAQAIGVLANLLWVAPASYATFRLIDLVVGNRIAARVEVEGLDIPETGVLGYVAEETHIVATAGQNHLASHGPGVPARAAVGPVARK